jgi:alkaline phosphatase D
MEPGRVEVQWEIADDEHFHGIVQKGQVWTAEEVAHSVHVEVRGLKPDRWYWYRFMVGDAVSSVGRTRTAPALGSPLARMRLAVASCQHFEQGYFSAYRHMAEEDVDLVLFVGDYIYESSWGDQPVRRHVGLEPYTLVEYRNRHAQYRTDPDLQRMHALIPWLVTWDDHEVDNDYANDQSEHLDPRFSCLSGLL